MYAIKEGKVKINGEMTGTFSRDVKWAGSNFEVEAGTTGFCKEARGYIRITAKDGDFFARVAKDDEGDPRGVEIAVSGCASLLVLLEAMGFAFQALIEGCEENGTGD